MSSRRAFPYDHEWRPIRADDRTIAIDYLSAEGYGERFPALAAECVRLNADVIAIHTTQAAQAAKKATRTIPIVIQPRSRRPWKNASNWFDRNVAGSNVMKQSRGTFLGCCARAAPGQAATAPPSSDINSRRFS